MASWISLGTLLLVFLLVSACHGGGGIRILNGGREIPLDRIASPGIVCGGPFGNRQNVLLALALRRGNAFITGNPLNT